MGHQLAAWRRAEGARYLPDRGITWWADYNLTFTAGKDANNGFVDLAAWVSIINQSGATYPEARLKLIAGDVHRAPVQRVQDMLIRSTAAPAAPPATGGFVEQSFDEFHLYTLGRRTTLPNNSTKQVELFDQTSKVPAQRLLVLSNANLYFGDGRYEDPNFPAGGENKVDTYLNSATTRPLAWACRCLQDASVCHVWMPRTVHWSLSAKTPSATRRATNACGVKLGSAFDVVASASRSISRPTAARAGSRKRSKWKCATTRTMTWRCRVREFLFRWSNWQVQSSSQAWNREDARTIVFPVKVPKNSNRTVRYRVRYSW